MQMELTLCQHLEMLILVTHAMTLFNEAKGVAKNIYLYNTMISKLAKARKADDALQLFREMKDSGLKPTSVTYGAVIAACCRVGDAESAENLFQEMASQSNFKPRIPPYNTMIQLYTQTKPDRQRALDYYNALLEAHIRPTAHTYKVIIRLIVMLTLFLIHLSKLLHYLLHLIRLFIRMR